MSYRTQIIVVIIALTGGFLQYSNLFCCDQHLESIAHNSGHQHDCPDHSHAEEQHDDCVQSMAHEQSHTDFIYLKSDTGSDPQPTETVIGNNISEVWRPAESEIVLEDHFLQLKFLDQSDIRLLSSVLLI